MHVNAIYSFYCVKSLCGLVKFVRNILCNLCLLSCLIYYIFVQTSIALGKTKLGSGVEFKVTGLFAFSPTYGLWVTFKKAP